MTLILKSSTPFASGGNRLCFVHPENSAICIKVRRPDFTLSDARRLKGFPKNLRPLSWFDDNQEEHQVMQMIARRFGEPAFRLVSRCYGFVETDMGLGLASELIRCEDGRVARSLKQYLWDHGYTDDLRAAVTHFTDTWSSLGIPSRDLLVHNLVVQCRIDGGIKRIVAIDGLGSPNLIPDSWLPITTLRRRAKRKANNLHDRIQSFLKTRDINNPTYLNYLKGTPILASRARTDPQGSLGMLIHDGHINPSVNYNGKLVAYGDCNTLGFGQEKGNGFPEQVASALGYSVSNLGHTMSTTRELLNYAKDFPPSKYDIALIQYGLVDSWLTFKFSPYVLYYPDSPIRKLQRKVVKKIKKYARIFQIKRWLGETEVVPLPEYIANIKHVVIGAPKTQFVLIGTAPHTSPERNPRIIRYNEALSKLALEHKNCIYVDAYEEILGKMDTLFSDNTHFNDEGLKIVSRCVLNALHTTLTKPSNMGEL